MALARPNGLVRSSGAGPRSGGRERPNFRLLVRAIRYVGRHRRLALLAYGSLFVATAAQLVVPQLVRVIIDAVVGGATQSNAAQALVGAMLAIIIFSVVRAVFA